MDIRNNRNAGVRLLLAAILTCIMLGLFGQLAKAQNMTPTDTTIVYRLGDLGKLELHKNLPNLCDYAAPIITGSYKQSIIPGVYKSTIEQPSPTLIFVESGIEPAGPNKSAIIEYLINLIIELMEPGETITIKKVE